MNAQSTMTVAANVETIQSVYAAFGRGDIAAIVGMLADGSEWDFAVAQSPVPWHQPARGAAEVTRFLGDFVGNTEVRTFEPRHFVAAGEDVMVHIHLAYTVKRTGKPVEEDQIHWWKLRNNRIIALRHFEDTAQVQAAWAA